MNQNKIIISTLIVILILIAILFYLYFLNKKESFEGIAGTSFVSRVPKGTIVAFYGTNIPVGWALCDGKDGKTPDLRGRFIIGTNPTCNGNRDNCNQNMFTFNPSQTGGSYNKKLGKSNIPKHTHNTYVQGYKGSGSTKGHYAWEGDYITQGFTYTSDGGDVGNSNNDVDPVDIIPPYYSLAYIMKL